MTTQVEPPTRIDGTPPPRPLLIYDGECGFCRLWIERWRARTADRVDYAAAQEIASQYPEIPAELYARSVVLILPDGSIVSGAAAVFGTLAFSPEPGWGVWAYHHVPGVAACAQVVYGAVARNRRAASAATRWLWGRHVAAPTYGIARCLFVRALGLAYLAAFVSLAVQAQGLVGSHGILPMKPYLEAAHYQLGLERYWLLPTWFWLDAGDAALWAVCAGGVLASTMVLLGLLPGPGLALAWTCYLSLATVCRVFLNFQWD
ncbi:MAG TPA: DCC1-like thiol-disulfide oxidoreductase family protein, partial [Candidatus Polarisedimenticolia bacterium]|nr:DCC1-like thiol-disulfide oxidoreductase family protein [Candidatus Polarisedimenticolia bacterium]